MDSLTLALRMRAVIAGEKQSKWPKYSHGTLDSIEVALVRKEKQK